MVGKWKMTTAIEHLDRAIIEISSAIPKIVTPPPSGIPFASEFNLPMQNLDKAWYEATRRFPPYNYHPERCEDWNLESGGDSDFGEPLVAPFSGVVLSAHNWGGKTGKVLQILGVTPDFKMIVWAGWHLAEMYGSPGQIVLIGEPLGTIGNADGKYAAHLHEQICIVRNMHGIPHPATFASHGNYDFVQPSVFYLNNGVSPDVIQRVTEYDGR
jgi:hypothetical protein